MNNFYIYMFLDPRKPGSYSFGEYTFDYEPFYVGKGKHKKCGPTSSREYDHIRECNNPNNKWHKHNKIRKIIKETGNNPIISRIQENLSEQNALNLEIKLIKEIGRCDLKTGPLVNLTDGGEGKLNHAYTEEYKIKYCYGEKNPNYQNGDKLRGCKGPMYGKKSPFKYHTEKNKKLFRELQLGKKNSFYGKHHTEETKNNISSSLKGKNNPFYGKIHSNETKQKISKANKGKKAYNAIKIKINDKIYNSITQACRELNMSDTKIKRLNEYA